MLPALNNIQFVHLSECQLRAFEEEKVAVPNFADVLVREANSINSSVETESVCSVIQKFDLSWKTMANQRRKFVVKRLRAIEDLDESQCNQLFDRMDQIVPIDWDYQRRKCILERLWIMKCMCSLSACS